MKLRNRLIRSAAAAACVLMLAAPGAADIISLSGAVSASVQEFRMGAPLDSDSASEGFPATSSELPLQVVALLNSEFPDQAAGAAAAQFADPRDLDQQNPEEFAINLTLSSQTPNVRYSATAESQEVRGVSFSAAELGLAEGALASLTGRLFVDGALVLLSSAPARDLSGAYARLKVTIVKQVAGQQDETVFSGMVELAGGPGGSATTRAEGQLPTGSLIISDLSALPDEFAALHVLVIPNLQIDYSYQALVGQQFTFVATVRVEAANLEDNVGVVALIGTPTNTVSQVIGATQGQQAAAKLLETIQSERSRPSGRPAFPAPAPLNPLFSLCGVFGLESAAGLLALLGLRCGALRRPMLRG